MSYQEYVVGFMLDVNGHVVLIRKNRPAWQAGRLNGVGGKIEPGESPADAMRREFHEEAGLDVGPWDHMLCLSWPEGKIWFYRLWVHPAFLIQVDSMTDEAIEIWQWRDVVDPTNLNITPNLRWLLPLAAYMHDRYEPFDVREPFDSLSRM